MLKGAYANRMYEGAQAGELHVGMGATEMSYSDRSAYTVQKIVSDKKIIVTRDHAVRIDANGASDLQEYTYESTPLYIGAPEMMCCNPYHYIIASNPGACKYQSEHGTCEGCEHYKKHRKTNGVTLVKTKNGWKKQGTSTYFTVGIREEFYDYSF